ncbi:cadmium-translocating P-type ATPase [Actinomycetaceae bacterium WB03_NA08]|uniref:Cadmium-translocating P-type ATPase n=1 Tax=Scrofimicrobium canadense TaxID=2652290 RepID=A0A6N7VQT7_9ACTO|nr:heavy metal translocating P-type ATPase [Scrofimicrobium canadense]MSS84097.1 cadmium-translocating P-type ATPase [Scrofimicrobium canadense]
MKLLRQYPVVALAVVVAAVAAGVYFLYAPVGAQVIVSVFVGIFCLYTLIDMVRQILRGHFGLDVLALIAMLSTLAVGEYWASLIVVLMLSGGEALEDYAQRRASGELTALLDRSPAEAHVVVAGDETCDVPVNDVQVGDVIIVRPAEVVPVDGELMSSVGTFDQSSLTGESLPVTLNAGAEVASGSVNGSSAVKIQALRPACDSQYQQIIRLVQEAQDSKAPVVRLADRFAVPFTAISLTIAACAWWFSGDPVRFAEVLVLATPCPLLIAAPVAFMGGMSRAAKNGVVVKGGAVLEAAARIHSAAFDKTGTLTEGRPEVVRVEGPSKVLAIAASAEQYSSHVLAEGIRRAASGTALPAADRATEVPAEGVEALIDGHTIRVGRYDFAGGDVRAELRPGEVAVYVSSDGLPLGTIILADAVRPEAEALVEWMRGEGTEHIVMVTGDAQAAADAVGAEVGVDRAYADLRPSDKVSIVTELGPKPTLMVGDGVNDAPVLAAASVGVAMGARGSTAAGEAADAVVLQDSLTGVASLIAIAKHTLSVALTAIWLGVVLSVVLMLVATTGVIPAIFGALGQEILDLVAILYALRALGGKLPSLRVPSPTPHPASPQVRVMRPLSDTKTDK